VPIHDQTYRRYAGTRDLAGRAWMVIARNGVLGIIKKRLFLGLLLLAWLPFVIGAVTVYLAANYPQFSNLLGLTGQRFRDFLETQNFFVFVITVWVGAGLIANDKRANALQIYLSKPLTRVEYVAGKLAILAAFLLLVTWVPAIILLMLQVAFTGSFSFLRQNFYLFPAVTVFAFLQVLLASFSMLALSSISKSSRYVAILYAGAVFFSDAVYGIIFLITGSTRMSWLSVPANMRQVGDVIFRLQPRYPDTPFAVSLLAIFVLIGLSAWLLERQVRGVEVVS
jgi:ABC-2 type transport system permease protein